MLPATLFAAAAPIAIGLQPTYERLALSPALAAGTKGLDFALAPGAGSRGPTIALLGVARVPVSYAETYAARIEGALFIVAIDLRTGAVYQATAEGHDIVPLAKAMRPDIVQAGRDQVERYFNVDLGVQLDLPRYGAKYAVFVWLDDLVSPVRIAQMPGDPNRESQPKPVDAAAAGMHVGRMAATLNPGDGIALRGAGSRVFAAVGASVDRSRLGVLLLDFRTRGIVSLTFSLPKREDAFDFDVGLLGGIDPAAASGTQKTFVVVAGGSVISPVLVVDRTVSR
jgi:hypothetical protein